MQAKNKICEKTRGSSGFVYSTLQCPNKSIYFSNIDSSMTIIKSIMLDIDKFIEIYPKIKHNVAIFNAVYIIYKRFVFLDINRKNRLCTAFNEKVYIDYVPKISSKEEDERKYFESK